MVFLVVSRRLGRGDSVNQIGPMLMRSILAAGVSAAAASLRVLSMASIRTSEFAGGTIISPQCADGPAQLDSCARLVEGSDDNFRVPGITGTSRPVSGSAAPGLCAKRERMAPQRSRRWRRKGVPRVPGGHAQHLLQQKPR